MNGDGFGDLIVGASGADPNGNDRAGESYVVFGFDLNPINGSNGDDRLIGTPNPDFINGLEGKDTINGEGSNDTIDGGAGNDSLTGGTGQDQFTFAPGEGTDTITDFGGVGTGNNPSSAVINEVDTLKFSGEAFTAENLLLTQNGPNLELSFAGVENTQVILENFALENLENLSQGIGNILFDGQGTIEDGFDVVNANSTLPRVFNPNTVTFLNELDNNTSGFNNSNDVINAQGGDDTLSGLTGNDLLRGGAGDDFLTGGTGQDRFAISAGEGTDTITDFGGVGTGSNPPQAVIDEVDTLEFSGSGLSAENRLLTQNGADLELAFEGSEDTQVILEDSALENLENLSQGIGNILFDGQQEIEDSFDVVNADSALPRVFNRNTVTFLNDLDNNTSGFNNSNDVINGQGGEDTLSGLSGDDLLRGGAGDDSLTGNSGADRFAFSTASAFDSADLGIDILTDFAPGEDEIVLSKTTFTAIASAAGGPLEETEFATADSDAEVAQSSASIVYSLGTGNLFYNQNGADPELGTGGQFAVLSGSPDGLSTADFFVA